LDEQAGERMRTLISEVRAENDSVGGIVECAALGLPAGLGEHMFDGVENRVSALCFGIPGVKGIEFGEGFGSARLRGSENNDPFTVSDGVIKTTTNNSGGCNGGIANGMPVVFRAAFKPTASIGKPQQTVNLETMEETELIVKGRHDPCVAVRAVPVVEAVTALVLTDLLLTEGKF
jgi:chorismate synthase